MKIETENNMRFDDDDPNCRLLIYPSEGKSFAFVQAIDLGMPHARHTEPLVRRYWGCWDYSNPVGSVQTILMNGGKWPDLPPAPSNLMD
ncbi:MAG: hypothetical protein JAZ11_06965 [Candidatus Thiodiazotropha lotti]|nr:hypothetical protein [Candidatus Thiodiazotropha lotti]